MTGTRIRPRRGGFPPGPGPLRSLRLFDGLFDDPVPWFGQLQRRYGNLVGLRAGPVRVVVTYDPDLIERLLIRDSRQLRKGAAVRATRVVLGNGLVTADGDEHRRNRRIAAPEFSPRNVDAFVPSMLEHAAAVVSTWPDDGIVTSAVDARDLSLQIAGSSIFGTRFDAAERAMLHAAMHELDDGYKLVTTPGGVRAVRSGLTPRGRRMRRAGEQIDQIVQALVAGRRQASDSDQLRDLLSRLLAARDEDGSAFDDTQLRDEAVTMLLAGHDTTAAALGWCLVALGQHPDVQQRVHLELRERLEDRVPTASELRDLPLLRAFVDEVMRLHPTGYSTAREVLEPMALDDGVTLRPGTDVIVPFGWLLRDPRWWTDPLELRIDRFLPGGEALQPDRPRVAYIPFGLGPRVCIGAAYAIQLLLATLSVIVRSHELALDPGTQVGVHTGFIRSPRGDVPMRVRRRRSG